MVQVLAVEEDPAAVSPVFGQKKELRQSASPPARANRHATPDDGIIAAFAGGRKESLHFIRHPRTQRTNVRIRGPSGRMSAFADRPADLVLLARDARIRSGHDGLKGHGT
jgi:hypothetical protein